MGKVINGIHPSLQWSDVLEMINDSRIDSVGLNERVNSLATRSIKRDSKLEALNMIVSMCDLTTLEGEDTEGKIYKIEDLPTCKLINTSQLKNYLEGYHLNL